MIHAFRLATLTGLLLAGLSGCGPNVPDTDLMEDEAAQADARDPRGDTDDFDMP